MIKPSAYAHGYTVSPLRGWLGDAEKRIDVGMTRGSMKPQQGCQMIHRNGTHQRAGARRVDFKTGPTDGSG